MSRSSLGFSINSMWTFWGAVMEMSVMGGGDEFVGARAIWASLLGL